MRVLVFKPGFSVPTPWAYGRMAASAPRGYVTPDRAESMLSAWVSKAGAPLDGFLFNSMEKPVFPSSLRSRRFWSSSGRALQSPGA